MVNIVQQYCVLRHACQCHGIAHIIIFHSDTTPHAINIHSTTLLLDRGLLRLGIADAIYYLHRARQPPLRMHIADDN